MALHLKRVTAPLFVMQGSGLNDDLNGVERPVAFRCAQPERARRDRAQPGKVESAMPCTSTASAPARAL